MLNINILHIFQVLDHFKNIAITDSDGDFNYEDLFRRYVIKHFLLITITLIGKIVDVNFNICYCYRACRLSKEISSALTGEKIDQKICVLCPNGLSFVVAQWATWMTGNIFVPLSSKLRNVYLHRIIILLNYFFRYDTKLYNNILLKFSENHSLTALEYFVKDCKASLIIGTDQSSDMLNLLSKKVC